MNRISFRIVVTAMLLVAAPAYARKPKELVWQQVHAEISYHRSGTIATAKEGHFDYKFEATIDQLMGKREADRGKSFGSYFQPYTHEISMGLSGTTSLTADVSQFDEATQKTYHSTASLVGALKDKDDLHIEDIGDAYPWEEGLGAKFRVHSRLKGTFTADYPLIDGMKVENYISLWPSSVTFDEEKGFVAEGDFWARPVLKTEPKEDLYHAVYLAMNAANQVDEIPNQNGFKPPGVGAVSTGSGDDWHLDFEKTVDVDTLTGGHYKETITLHVRPVKTTLPIPKLKPRDEESN